MPEISGDYRFARYEGSNTISARDSRKAIFTGVLEAAGRIVTRAQSRTNSVNCLYSLLLIFCFRILRAIGSLIIS